jgi:uncharacterized membrane protein YfcA
MIVLSVAFFITALLYACIGFGGGSTYNALLILGDTDYRIVPLIALVCNIVVVTGGVWHFSRKKHLRIYRILPWILFSVPASFLGGLLPISEIYFIGILGAALLLSGIRLLWPEKIRQTPYARPYNELKYIPPILGSGLGLLAGLTGIGGGIFLAPILHFLNWGNAKQIAAACAIFILFNSLAGIAGQTFKLNDSDLLGLALPYLVLVPAVLVGGQIGSWLGASQIKAVVIKKMTALLILYVSARLLFRFFNMI